MQEDSKIQNQMEEFRERKFVCKFCSKRFPCGKSLGGHIRVHMNTTNSTESEDDETNKLKRESGFEAGGQSGYGLRENPKKTKKFVDQTDVFLQSHQLACKECGKGFNSMKALCGHMACHSEREKVLMDSQSDTETSGPSRRRRSNRMKYKGFDSVSAAAVFNGVGGGEGYNNSSSAVSEIEHEQEELARCLMMLSRDYSSPLKGILNSVTESSDNNSVVLEAKSSSVDVRISLNNVVNALKIEDQTDYKLKSNDQYDDADADDADADADDDSDDDDSDNDHDHDDDYLSSDNSDSGYFRNGPKKVDSDVSVDGFLKKIELDKPNPIVESGSGFDDLKGKSMRSFGKFKSVAEFSRAKTKYDLRKTKRVVSSYNNPQKKAKCELKNIDYLESAYESGENSLETDSCADPNSKPSGYSKIGTSNVKNPNAVIKKLSTKKKSKGHECPICFRVFKSGQALGGHKRSHFIGNQDDTTVVIREREEVTKMSPLIDLNLPAPDDNESLGHDGAEFDRW